MALVPAPGNPGNDEQYGANASNYFMQLLPENQQVNLFINNWSLEHAGEEQAEARHRQFMDLIYTEAGMHIRSLEAHADAEHARRLAFIQQGTNVLITQLNSEMSAYKAESEMFQSRLLRSEVECHGERQAAQQLTSQSMALTTRTTTPL